MNNFLDEIKERISCFPKYKNLLVGITQKNDYYQINHYMPNFDIFDMEFHDMMGKIIQEVFYNRGITNVGQLNLIEEELKEYFPEMFDIQIEEKLEVVNKNKAILKRNILFIEERKEEMPSTELYSSNENIYYSQAA